MYEFIKIQYRLGRLNAGQVLGYAPRWITTEQAENIINTCKSASKQCNAV